jgi:hypothetical protein
MEGCQLRSFPNGKSCKSTHIHSVEEINEIKTKNPVFYKSMCIVK